MYIVQVDNCSSVTSRSVQLAVYSAVEMLHDSKAIGLETDD